MKSKYKHNFRAIYHQTYDGQEPYRHDSNGNQLTVNRMVK